MKVIILGPETITDNFVVMAGLITSPWARTVKEIVSGGRPGVDKEGEQCGLIYGVPVKRFYTRYKRYGKAAGFICNQQMAWYADALVAIWDGRSPRTDHMISFMERIKKPVHIYRAEKGD